jgi:hypothetical protein
MIMHFLVYQKVMLCADLINSRYPYSISSRHRMLTGGCRPKRNLAGSQGLPEKQVRVLGVPGTGEALIFFASFKVKSQ